MHHTSLQQSSGCAAGHNYKQVKVSESSATGMMPRQVKWLATKQTWKSTTDRLMDKEIHWSPLDLSKTRSVVKRYWHRFPLLPTKGMALSLQLIHQWALLAFLQLLVQVWAFPRGRVSLHRLPWVGNTQILHQVILFYKSFHLSLNVASSNSVITVISNKCLQTAKNTHSMMWSANLSWTNYVNNCVLKFPYELGTELVKHRHGIKD